MIGAVGEMVSTCEIVGGLALIAILLRDAFETMILPRRLSARFRLTRWYFRGGWPLWRWPAGWLKNRSRREYWLSLFGPFSMLLLFVLWAVGLMIGFAVLYHGLGSPLQSQEPIHGFEMDIYLSGVTFLTLGIGTAIPLTGLGRLLAVAEGGLGLGFIAVIISYLPVLYGGFSNRESSISMLDAHAGSPPSASEWLSRGAANRGQLEQYLAEWERWAASLLESQISYPVLGYFRSQHVNQSWLAALTALLDTCALLIAGTEDGCANQARLTFAMARHAVVDLAQIFIHAIPPEIPDRLPASDLASMRARLDASGLRLRLEPDALHELDELRRMYEPHVFAMGQHLLLDLPAWIGDANAADNWQRSPWDRHGRARRLPAVGERHF